MQIKCLFWNIKDIYNQERIDFLNNYAATSSDVIILAEAYNKTINTSINGFSLIQPLQTSGREWIKIFLKDKVVDFELTRVDELFHNRVCVARLRVNKKKDILLFCVHLNSKVGIDEKTQLILNDKAAQEIHEFLRRNHNRAIIVGDFNHNPYESIMNSNLTFNSLSNRELARQLKYRTYTREHRTIFYNPMWNFVGDHDFQNNQERFNGTYFFKSDSHKTIDHLHWNLLDQILVSTPIIDSIHPNDIKIVTEYFDENNNTIYLANKSFYLLSKTYLNPDFSDHLPIQFSINTKQIN